MMNRAQRRAARYARIATSDRQTHKLKPQTCVVWVPDASGYAALFDPANGEFTVSSVPELAYHLTEDEAEELAMAVRHCLRFRAEIRTYRAHAPG